MMKYGKDIKQHLCKSQKRRNCDTLDSIQHRTERIFFSLVENNKQIDSKRCQRKMRWKKIEKRDIHTQDASYTKAHSNISSVNNTRYKWKLEKKSVSFRIFSIYGLQIDTFINTTIRAQAVNNRVLKKWSVCSMYWIHVQWMTWSWYGGKFFLMVFCVFCVYH